MKQISEKQAKQLQKIGQGHRVIRTKKRYYLIEDLHHTDSSGKPKLRFQDDNY